MSVLKGVLFENENVLTLWPAVGEESSVKPCIFSLVPLNTFAISLFQCSRVTKSKILVKQPLEMALGASSKLALYKAMKLHILCFTLFKEVAWLPSWVNISKC